MLQLQSLVDCLATAEGRGVDTLDPRFQDIASLVEQADFAGAAAKCQETFAEGAADIRVISWFLLGLSIQDGVKGLGPLFETMATLFADRFAAVGPEKKKDHHATAGMSWFLGKLADRVDDAAEAERLAKRATLEEVTAALAGLDRLFEAFRNAVPLNPGKVADPQRRVRDWLAGLESALTVPPEPEPVAAPEPEPPPPAAVEAPAAGGPVASGAAPTQGAPMVEASYRMLELQARLAAFETLMARGDVAKAALVADDVMEVMAHFDPRLYLPRLFAGFFAAMSRRTDEVLAWRAKKGSAPWAVFDQLYRTDLDAFVRCADADFQRLLSGAAGNNGAAHAPQPAAAAPPPPAPEPQPSYFGGQNQQVASQSASDDW